MISQAPDRTRSLNSLRPGTFVQILYPPYAEGAFGVITARESPDRWLVSIPEDDLRSEPLLLSLREPELRLAEVVIG